MIGSPDLNSSVRLEREQLILKTWVRETDMAPGKSWGPTLTYTHNRHSTYVFTFFPLLGTGTEPARSASADNKNLITIGRFTENDFGGCCNCLPGRNPWWTAPTLGQMDSEPTTVHLGWHHMACLGGGTRENAGGHTIARLSF